MQIYLPFDVIPKNIAILSEKDLGHQRNCALTILDTIAGKGKGWAWHPGVNMWYGSEHLLGYIANLINEEWAQQAADSTGTTRKSYDDLVNRYKKSLYDLGFSQEELNTRPKVAPWWWKHERFHQGEKAMLLRYDPDWYGQFLNGAENDLCEWWPRHDKDEFIYGPQRIGPESDFTEYWIRDTPIFRSAYRMSPNEFTNHANTYHNLMPGALPLGPKEPILDSMRSLHDRFHQKRTYHTHEHII